MIVECLTEYIDLESLQLRHEEHGVKPIDVRCRQCEAQIQLWVNDIDTLKSIFKCTSDAWTCGISMAWYDLFMGDKNLNHLFYTIAEIPEGKLYKMELIENVGPTAFNHLREATYEEREQEALDRLGLHRDQAEKALRTRVNS